MRAGRGLGGGLEGIELGILFQTHAILRRQRLAADEVRFSNVRWHTIFLYEFGMSLCRDSARRVCRRRNRPTSVVFMTQRRHLGPCAVWRCAELGGERQR